ncbi:hypothetical protein ScPMuIL_005438 [Solemya velum]
MSRKFGVVLYFVYICSIQSTKGIYERYFSVGKLVQFDFDEDDTFTRCMLLEHSQAIDQTQEEQKIDVSWNEADVTILTEQCKELSWTHHSRRRIKRRIQTTYPGTNWFGPGNTADSYSDLGREEKTDHCCRQHDHCPIYMGAFTRKYGLWNSRFYTVSDCGCDETFHQCLKDASKYETIATSVGDIFFNKLRIICIKRVQVSACLIRFGLLCMKRDPNRRRWVWRFQTNHGF